MEVSVHLYVSTALPPERNSQIPIGRRMGGGGRAGLEFLENNALPLLAFEPRTVTVPTELPMLSVCGVPAVLRDDRVMQRSAPAPCSTQPALAENSDSPLAACFCLAQTYKDVQYINS